jgi:hypothetical protein
MKKLNLFGMFALILAFGIIFASCDSEEPDTWTTVTSINQLDGSWKGSYNKTRTYKEWYAKWGNTWSDQSEALYGSMSMKWSLDQILTINAGAGTLSWATTYKRVYSGGKISSAWDLIKTWDWSDNATFNDNDHSVTQTTNSGPSTFNWNLSYVQINQNGKKIKYSTEIFDDPVSDYTLTKQ